MKLVKHFVLDVGGQLKTFVVVKDKQEIKKPSESGNFQKGKSSKTSIQK